MWGQKSYSEFYLLLLGPFCFEWVRRKSITNQFRKGYFLTNQTEKSNAYLIKLIKKRNKHSYDEQKVAIFNVFCLVTVFHTTEQRDCVSALK